MSEQPIQLVPNVQKKKKAKYVRKILILISLLTFCGIIFSVIFILKIDLLIFSLSFSGKVTDESGTGLNQVTLVLNDLEIQTNESGLFVFSGLEEGTYSLKIEKQGFAPINKNVDIYRNGFSYSIVQNFILKNTEIASLSGKFVVEDQNYKFRDDRIVINDQQSFQISEDGSFNLKNIGSGETKFEYRSKNFKDILQNLNLNAGINQIADVDLIPAGDIIQSVESYIREKAVSNISVTGAGVDKDSIEISNTEIIIKDLEIGQTYNIRVSAPGYETRDYSKSITQGENKLDNFQFVEAGTTVFLAEIDGSTDPLFYSSDFDGTDKKNLIPEEFEEKSYYLDSSKNKLFIQTEKDRIQSYSGGRTTTIYEYDLNNNVLKKITENTDRFAFIFPFYKAGKLINIYEESRNNIFILEIGDLSGNNRKEIERVENLRYEKVLLSANSQVLAAQYSNDTLVTINTSSNLKSTIHSGDSVELRAISDNGKRIIYSRNASSSNFTDLFMYDLETKEERPILVDEKGNNYQFLKNSDSSIIYFDSRRNQTDIYKFDIDLGRETKITNLTSFDKIVDLYQFGEYTYYVTNRGLYIIDILNPKTGKLVINW